MQSCCLFHKVTLWDGEFLLAPHSGAMHCPAITVQSRGDVSAVTGASSFVSTPWVLDPLGCAVKPQLWKDPVWCFVARRNHFDCRAGLNLGQRLVCVEALRRRTESSSVRLNIRLFHAIRFFQSSS